MIGRLLNPMVAIAVASCFVFGVASTRGQVALTPEVQRLPPIESAELAVDVLDPSTFTYDDHWLTVPEDDPGTEVCDPGSLADPDPQIHLRGRINADAVFVNQSASNQAIFGDYQNAVGFRRARLGAHGQVGGQVEWLSEFDFAGGEVAFKDVWIGLKDLPWVRRVRVGHMREPFSLEGQISSNDITFNERSPSYGRSIQYATGA